MIEETLDMDQLQQAVKALKMYVDKKSQSSTTKNLISISDGQSVQLQFSYKKIPTMERKNIKVVLPHSPVHAKTTSVCLFVKDLIKTREYEKTIKKYQAILSSSGIVQDIEIFPLKKLKLEYGDFEAKRNLANAYDIFLADARITRLLPALLGKHFVGHHKFPLQVRLNSKDLNAEIKKAFATSQCNLSGKGSTCQIVVGSLSQENNELVENVLACATVLQKEVPGGAANIRNMVLKTPDSKALPIYLSLGSKDEVILPKSGRKRDRTILEEVTTVIGSKVSANAAGVVKLKSAKKV
jgi:ribosome biogenesis protein UTP30